MSKITLQNVSSIDNSLIAAINNNNAILTTAMDNTLSRNGQAPDQMQAQLDMNGNAIINLPFGVSSGQPLVVGQSPFNPGVTIGGDVSGIIGPSNNATLTLDTVNSTPGTFGDATDAPVVTVNGKGLITAITTIPITGGGGGGGSGQLISRTLYSGSQTVTIPAGAHSAWIQMWGATGGSGGVKNTTAIAISACTGSAGYLEKYVTGLTPGNTWTYNQGAAGAAGTNTPGNGGSATNTFVIASVGVTFTITVIGSTGSIGISNSIDNNSYSGGPTPSGGDINIQGIASNPNILGIAALQGAPGITFYSVGAKGVFQASAGSSAGIAGSPGGLIVSWFT